MYNAIFGFNEYYKEILSDIIGVSEELIPRFRDAYLSPDGTKAYIYTRTGGPNRDDYSTLNEFLCTLPGFNKTWDDSMDETFAIFEYEVSPYKLERAKEIASVSDTRTPEEKNKELLSTENFDDLPERAKTFFTNFFNTISEAAERDKGTGAKMFIIDKDGNINEKEIK